MKKCLLALALLFAVLLSGCAIVQTTDLADYGNTGGETWHGSAVFDLLSNLTSTGEADGTQSAAPPRMQELFPIFPPDALLQRAQDRDYHHLYRYTLLQDELFTRLSCRYSAADYQAEVDRLAALGAFSGLFSESLFSVFFPLAFVDGLCRGGGRLLAVLSLLVWAAIRVLLALLLLRLWPLLQKPEK